MLPETSLKQKDKRLSKTSSHRDCSDDFALSQIRRRSQGADDDLERGDQWLISVRPKSGG
jgi:hypothetical protein